MKSRQLQIRVTPSEKAALRRLAKAAGQDVSQYVLSRVLPDSGRRFRELVARLGDPDEMRFALAGVHDQLTSLGASELASLPGDALRDLEPVLRCRVAAMVELACVRAGAAPPSWVSEEPPLEAPDFAVPLRSLRLHVLKTSPVAFRRRNLFVDAVVGDRV